MITTDEEIEEFLEHFGIKGMHWGVRKETKKSNVENAEKVDHSRRNKRISIVLGSAAVAGALVAGAFYAKKHFNVELGNLGKSNPASKKFAESLAEEPVHVFHSARGRDRGHMFLQGGGLKNPLSEFDKAGLENAGPGYFKRYGQHSEKVAAVFNDPLGRKDRAGRGIQHSVILPKSMVNDDIQNADQVRDRVWPNIKHLYGAVYNAKPDTLGPGF